jgi:hypothetical protein
MHNWESPKKGECKADDKAFIFSIDNQKIYKVVKSEYAIWCNSKWGPSFGGFTLLIDSDPMNQQNECKTRTNG